MRTCVLCDTEFAGFGNSPSPLATEGLCCDTCNFTKVIRARFTTIPENTQPGESESESDEEELPGDLIAGATDPRTVITYTMAGGGSHWWNYEVHFKDGEQTDVYINNTNGKFHQRKQILYFHDDQPDQVRLEDRDFSDEKWHELVRY